MAFIHTSLTRLMRFAVDQTKDIIEPLMVTKVLTEFSESENDGLSHYAHYAKFHNYLVPNMAKLAEYSIEERVRVIFGFAAVVSDDFLKQIQREGLVHLDKKKRICKFTSHNGKWKLEGDHSHSARMKRRWSMRVRVVVGLPSLMNFLVEKTKDIIEPMLASAAFREFSESEDGGLPEHAYYNHFHKNVAPNMAKIEEYSIEERVRVMFALAGRVSADFRAQTKGLVELDDGKRISKFTSTDGKLKLEGDHSDSARRKRSAAFYRKTDHHCRSANDSKPRRKNGRQSDSEFSDKSGSDEDDVESAISYGNSPKRARCEKSADPEMHVSSGSDDDEVEDVGGMDEEPVLLPIDSDESHIGHLQNGEEMMVEDDNQPIPEDPQYSANSSHQGRRMSGRIQEKLSASIAQETTDAAVAIPHVPILNPPFESDDEEVKYIGAVKGQPKPGPIESVFDQINNRDHFQGNQEYRNQSISERKVDVPLFVEHQQISLSAENRATSAEWKSIFLHDFLKQLTQFICFFECSELAEIKRNIKEVMADEGKISSFQKLEIIDIRTVLGAFFFGVSRKIKSTGSNNSTMKAKDFLVTFKYFLLGLDFSELLELSTVFKRKLTSQILQRRFSCTATSAKLSKTYSPQFLNNSNSSHCFLLQNFSIFYVFLLLSRS
ncbi:SPK domain-containing protein [Caenorhabditis elegans]|uniref:SPK domain-containing protein n=1 Tax=Caenorhabditis elegans TaxID=6239 RepID=Q9NA88_CAEEL|nr:SPK domain-containing protein [Caenorhabditis elegans]CAB55009.2 SPK domain-containing protein [Caenorhabditis elegans]|eukprot:NP_496584.2 Uncharacterized protein CELE_Y57A10A.4 [Caenorhabditis elegans]